MSKRLCFLVSIVFVLGLSGAAQAAVAIDINNFSFEFLADGNYVTCHTGMGGADTGVMAWVASEVPGGSEGWSGVDIDCCAPGACPPGENTCKTWWVAPDGNSVCYIDNYNLIYQVLDMNNSDANAIIVEGRQYTVTFPIMTYTTASPGAAVVASLFYPEDLNYPDEEANHVPIASKTILIEERPYDDVNEKQEWMYGQTVNFVCEAGSPAIGRTLGIKFFSPPPDSDWVWVDDVHAEWVYATYAYEPYPAYGEKYVDRKVVLNWKSGTYTQDVNGHHVYFGTDKTEVENADTSTAVIYRGVQDFDVNNYDTSDYYLNVLLDSNGLVLGKTYYWRIDEVNDAYDAGWQPGDEPPQGPWKGEVWKFTVEGKAYNYYPPDGSVDIPFLDLSLEWTAGRDAGGHDVYFSSDVNAVRDANTNTVGVYRGSTQPLDDVNWLVPNAEVVIGDTYYWRIDEVNATTVMGDVWSYTTGPFLIVDDMDSYYGIPGHEIYETWGDYRVNSTGAQVSLWLSTADVNFVRDGNSMKFYYRNTIKIGKYVGSKIEALTTDLQFGLDWTAGGVKSLSLWFYGDPCNIHDEQDPCDTDQMYVALETIPGSYVVSIYKEDMYNVKEASWHEWVIPLEDFNGVVTLSNVTKMYIGFGGYYETGQSSNKGAGYGGFGDTVFFDDIRLYPPRCLPGYEAVTDFTGDCITDYADFDIMAQDWMLTDGNSPTENRPAVLTGFPNATSHWTTDCAVGTGAIEVDDGGCKIDVTDPRLNGLESMSITAWIKQTIANSWVGVVCSREEVGCGDDATEIGVYGKAYGGPDGLGYDWSCGTEEWQWDAGLDVPVDGTWTFIAMVVDPTGCTLYMRPDSNALQTGARNTEAHPWQQNFSEGFYIGRSNKGGGGPFVGKIDDVRIYTYNLSFDDVNNLAYKTATDPNPWPVYHYEFEETTGYTAADSGTPTIVYGPVPSVANLTDPEQKLQRAVNFKDFRILADDWLKEYMWPFEE